MAIKRQSLSAIRKRNGNALRMAVLVTLHSHQAVNYSGLDSRSSVRGITGSGGTCADKD